VTGSMCMIFVGTQ